MPNRVIRESLLDSDRYWSVSIEARELFFHLMLLADDVGCVSLAPAMIRRRCFDGAPGQKKIDGLVLQLADVDLIRRYEIDGSAFAFIPRFRQRLQIMKPKCPVPPKELFEDDSHAKSAINKLKDLAINPTVGQQMPNGYATDGQRTESKRIETNHKALDVESPTRELQHPPLQNLFKKFSDQEPDQNRIERNRETARKLAIGEISLTKP